VTDHDVIVVGGGSAGCVLAARLTEAGRRVCLIEAGPDYGPYDGGRWPSDILDARQLAFSHSWETEREDRSQLRARILGGCSAHNACVMLPGAPADYDEWGHGWSHASIAPYLERAERELRTRRFGEEELSPWHRAFAGAAGADAILHPVNAVGAVRWNAAFAYLDRARDAMTVMADTLVDRVLLDGDRAIGVACSAGELRGEHVVLAAGAYGSPGILLRSDIGPSRGLPVGEGLIDHVGVGFGYQPTVALTSETTAYERQWPLFMGQVTVEARSSVCDEGVCDLFLFPAIELLGPDVYEISAGVFAMKPASRGSVRLTSRDPRAPLAIDHGSCPTSATSPSWPKGSSGCARLSRTRRSGSTARTRHGRDPMCPRRSTCGPRRAASSIRSGRARSAVWSTVTGGCSGSRGCRWPTRRSCRPSRARTPT
jgi:GMC oxidoreductase/Lycopene cyclase protein